MRKILITISLFLFLGLNAKGLPKEYYDIRSSSKQKDYFFEHLYPLIKKENKIILEDREFVSNYLKANILNLDYASEDFARLLKLKKRYNVKKLFNLEEYLKKIDIVPPSLALAQAAVESGWGKSRFIKEANNIFGHWTYDEKIGLLPENRDEDATHFIRIFRDLSHSIKKYMLNLNSNRAYRSFQEERFAQRKADENLDGIRLSQTLVNYSGIGEEYLKILKKVIEENKLLKYDE